MKTDPHGKVQWTHTHHTGPALDMIQTVDGGFALTGIQGGGLSPRAESSAFLVKTNAHGEMEWKQIYDWGDQDRAVSVVQTRDGGFVIAGSTFTFSYESVGGRDGWLGKTDASGTLEWHQTYGDSNADFIRSVIQTADGSFALAGYTDGDAWLVKTNALGELQWNRTYGGGYDKAYSVIQLTDGNFILTGSTDGNAWLVQIDADGNLEWTRSFGGSEIENTFSGIQTADGGFALAGFTESYGAGERDAWLVKTDTQGMVQWNRTYGGSQSDTTYSVVETADGGFALAGTTDSYGAEGGDALVVKTDAWGLAPEPEIPLPRWVVLGIGGSLALIVTIAVGLWRRKKRI